MPPAVAALSLNHWTPREILHSTVLSEKKKNPIPSNVSFLAISDIDYFFFKCKKKKVFKGSLDLKLCNYLDSYSYAVFVLS